MLKNTNALPMPPQGLMEIVDAPRILWEQRLQKGMRVVCCYFLADETQSNAHAVDVHIYPCSHLVTFRLACRELFLPSEP